MPFTSCKLCPATVGTSESVFKKRIWCLLTTGSYEASVLQAVNPGGDTDTTAAVTGGLAGLFYGLDNISEQWLKQLARYDDINDLAERLVARTTYLFSVNFFPLHAFGNHRIFM